MEKSITILRMWQHKNRKQERTLCSERSGEAKLWILNLFIVCWLLLTVMFMQFLMLRAFFFSPVAVARLYENRSDITFWYFYYTDIMLLFLTASFIERFWMFKKLLFAAPPLLCPYPKSRPAQYRFIVHNCVAFLCGILSVHGASQ